MRKMKDSGVEWIGDIPENWELSKIGAVYDNRNIKVSDKEYAPLSITKQGVVPQLETAAKTDNGDNRKLVRKNDFVINSRSDRRGSCGISELDGSCSLINTVLKPRKNMCNRYYGFVFKSDLFADEFYRWGHGIVDDLWSTKWSDMKSIYIPMPSINEQERIADYLDEKCSKIDAIIARQEEIIEKLKEYKLSIITEAVTKGVNPDVEMKDSGNEWIGVIPSSWTIVSLGAVSKSMRNGYVGPTRDIFHDEGVPYIQSLHVKDGVISFEKEKYFVSEEWGEKHPKVHEGQLLIVQTGDIGQVGLVTEEMEGYNCHALIIVTVKEEYILPKYLMYYLRSHVGKELLLDTKTGALLPHLNSGKIKATAVVCPDIENQKIIVKYLEKKCYDIDAMINKKQCIINKIQKYKKSLIYEVVTGKKEV